MTNASNPSIDEGYPVLEKQGAFRLVSDAKKGGHAIEGLSQALIDLFSSSNLPREKESGEYRVAATIMHHQEKLAHLQRQLFRSLQESRITKAAQALSRTNPAGRKE